MKSTAKKPWKASFFNHFHESLVEGITIGFNAYRGSFMTMDLIESSRVAQILDFVNKGIVLPEDPLVEELIAGGFLVAGDANEEELVRSKYWNAREQGGVLSLTIAPTVSCNFGCTYCFQEHPKRSMSKHDIEHIIALIDEKLRPGGTLGITWFGGEPLAAFPLIEELSTRIDEIVTAKDARRVEGIITNGSLLDERKISFLENLAGLDYVQITVDGSREVHDLRRVSSGGKGTYDRIMDNIVLAAGRLTLSIRVNIDKTNYQNLDTLLDDFVRRGIADKVSIYLGHVLPFTDTCADVESGSLSKKEFAAVDAQFKLLKFQKGFPLPGNLPRPTYGTICVADNSTGYVIAPGGRVFNCWNEVTDPVAKASMVLDDLGLNHTDTTRNNAREWDTYNPFAHEKCKGCSVMPLCRGGCPWESRKKDPESVGHCTPLKWNLADHLRLYHMGKVIKKAYSDPDLFIEMIPECAAGDEATRFNTSNSTELERERMLDS